MRYTREQACLAWLAQGMLGSRRLKKLLDEYGSAEAAYDAFQRDHGASLQNRISDYSLSLLRASASREKLHDMLVTMRKWNMGLVSMICIRNPCETFPNHRTCSSIRVICVRRRAGASPLSVRGARRLQALRQPNRSAVI